MTTATIGFRAENNLGTDDMAAKLGFGLALRTVIGGSEPGYTMHLAGANPFKITAPQTSGTEVLLDVSLDTSLSPLANARIAYEANIGSQGVNHSAKATLSVGF